MNSFSCGGGFNFNSLGTILDNGLVSLNIISSNFTNNKAINGSGLCIELKTNEKISGVINKVIFLNNYANNSGGGIYYNSYNVKSNLTLIHVKIWANEANKGGGGGFRFIYQPIYFTNNSLIANNKAFYGNNVASYPIYFKEKLASEFSSSDYDWVKTSTETIVNRVLLSNDNKERVLEEGEIIPRTLVNNSTSIISTSESVIPELVDFLMNFNLGNDSLNPKQDFPSNQINSIKGNFITGQNTWPPIIIQLFDEFNQVVKDKNGSVLTVISLDQNLKFTGSVQFKSINGSYYLYPLLAISEPGNNIKIQLQVYYFY